MMIESKIRSFNYPIHYDLSGEQEGTMTAEILIANRHAVALAADSALTMRVGEGQKIFASMNKIFSLSKFEPVGMMIFGNAFMMGVPWETLIKLYRGSLGDRSFDTLEGYAKDFAEFLKEEANLFTMDQQEAFFKENVLSYFGYLNEEALNKFKLKVQEVIGDNQVIDKEIGKEFEELVICTIDENYSIWKEMKDNPRLPKDFQSKLKKRFGKLAGICIKDAFGSLELTPSAKKKLRQNVFFLFIKDRPMPSFTGIVIAGFGDNDIFPTSITYRISGYLLDSLISTEYYRNSVSSMQHSLIQAFAQREMVDRFMEGVDPIYNKEIHGFLKEIIDNYPRLVLDTISQIDDNEVKKSVKKKLEDARKFDMDKYLKRLDEFRFRNYVSPILDVVSSLPKEELSALAESLVNLTTLKRKVSMEEETVKEPIDVAIISKGDGFVWIKRKHYFSRELNIGFFKNYYRDTKKMGDRRERRKGRRKLEDGTIGGKQKVLAGK